MKKLMLFAAAAAMVGGAFAADEEECCTTECAWGYKVKVIVKTTGSGSVSNKSTCSEGCYRKPTTRRYIGYFFGTTDAETGTCGVQGCSCISLEGKSRIAMWNYDTKSSVTPTSASLTLLDRIGKDDTSKCEIVFDTTYEYAGYTSALTFAGFGTVAKQASGKPAVKTASGFCAGTVPGVCYTCDEVCGVVQKDTCTFTPSIVWTICGEKGGAYITAAYGKWKMQWDAEIVSRITNNKTVVGDSAAEASGFTPSGYDTGVAAEFVTTDKHFIEAND